MLGLLVPGVGMGGGAGQAPIIGFGRMEYTMPRSQLEYTLEKELLDYTVPGERLEFTALEP